jgi:hypothetical protein
MKKFKSIRLLIPVIFLLITPAFAQRATTAKVDIVQKLNGEKMEGKVIRVTDNEVTFVYTGETAEYVLNKFNIAKIIHASGRVEVIDQRGLLETEQPQVQIALPVSPENHHNRLAVLPFTYLRDNRLGSEVIGMKAQVDTYDYLAKNAKGYTILDPRTTNAMLSRAGVAREQLGTLTMKEIADVLGVEYIVDGIVSQNKFKQTTSTSVSSGTGPSRQTDAAQTYTMAVTLHVYTDKNASVFNQTRTALFPTTDGDYISPLEYLLKRTPQIKK